MLLLVIRQRIQSADVWIVIQNHLNIDFVASVSSNEILEKSSDEQCRDGHRNWIPHSVSDKICLVAFMV